MTSDAPPVSISVPTAPALEIVPYRKGRTLVLAINGNGRCLGRFILEQLADPDLDLARVSIGDVLLVPEKTR